VFDSKDINALSISLHPGGVRTGNSSPTSEFRLGLMEMPDGSIRFIGKENRAMLDGSLSPQDGALTCKWIILAQGVGIDDT
jgi:hypothetical protein